MIWKRGGRESITKLYHKVYELEQQCELEKRCGESVTVKNLFLIQTMDFIDMKVDYTGEQA